MQYRDTHGTIAVGYSTRNQGQWEAHIRGRTEKLSLEVGC